MVEGQKSPCIDQNSREQGGMVVVEKSPRLGLQKTRVVRIPVLTKDGEVSVPELANKTKSTRKVWW